MSTLLNISDKIKLETYNPFLLDVYSGAAAAYSLRLLNPTYSGDAIVVTTDGSDSQSIGFNGLQLDTASLETFANGGDAYVATWYDQSGNGNNATQSTFSKMPKIVSSGSTILVNTKPSIEAIGGVKGLRTNAGVIGSTSALSSFLVGKANVTGQSNGCFYGTTSNAYGGSDVNFFMREKGNNFEFNLTPAQQNISSNTNQNLFAQISSAGNFLTAGVNGSTSTTTSSIPSVFNFTYNLELFGILNGIVGINGHIQEIVFYKADQSAKRTGIEKNINEFYSIY